MSIIHLQREAGQIGRIRIGTSVDTGRVKNGRAVRQPKKLTGFRFTTHSEFAAAAVAELLGGEAVAWSTDDGAPTSGQWQVFTEADQINVIVPPGPKAVDSWYEMWLPKMCVRRCDGQTEQKSGQACLCPEDLERRAADAARGAACRMTTRVNVMVPDLPGVGVWMLESHGFYAATEMTGVAEMLAAAGQHGVKIPARLRIEQRERRVYQGEGNKPLVKNFPVPVLEVLATLRQIADAAATGQLSLAASMPPAIESARTAISAGPAPSDAADGAAGGAARGPAVLAREALAASSTTVLDALWAEASPKGWLDEVVEDSDGVLEPLGGLIRGRWSDIAGGA